jgi:hypothetical protein
LLLSSIVFLYPEEALCIPQEGARALIHPSDPWPLLLVALLALVVTLVLGLIGAAVGASFIDQLDGVTLPGQASKAAQNVLRQGLTIVFSVSGILAPKVAWGTPEEDHIRCWANVVATLDSFTTMDEGIAPWGEEELT